MTDKEPSDKPTDADNERKRSMISRFLLFSRNLKNLTEKEQ